MCYYLFMKFRHNHHRYVLCHGSDELNNIRVPDLLQYSQLMPERVCGFLIGAAFSVKYLYGNLGAIPFRNVVHALFNMSLISQFPLISLASHSVLDEIFKNKVFYIGRKISPV